MIEKINDKYYEEASTVALKRRVRGLREQILNIDERIELLEEQRTEILATIASITDVYADVEKVAV